MYAVFKTGGKQYKAKHNDVLRIEKLEGEAGKKITFKDVLAVNDDKETEIGSPNIDGASVVAEIIEQTRDDKVIIFKKIRRHNHRRKNGHKQHRTVIRIVDIAGKGGKKLVAPKPAKEETPKATEAKEAKKETQTEAKAEKKAEAKETKKTEDKK